MSKPMTFEEWSNDFGLRDLIHNRDAFSAARIGMIPEDESVRIPGVEEWPKWALGISVRFVNYTEQAFDDLVAEANIRYIAGPDQRWRPEAGEIVFVFHPAYRQVIVGRIYYLEGEDVQAHVNIPFGEASAIFNLENIKPFAPEHIGKPWEEIPNGN